MNAINQSGQLRSVFSQQIHICPRFPGTKFKSFKKIVFDGCQLPIVELEAIGEMSQR